MVGVAPSCGPPYAVLGQNPSTGGHFCSELIQREPVEASPNFDLSALAPVSMLGLWSRQTVQVAEGTLEKEAELAFAVEKGATVDAILAE